MDIKKLRIYQGSCHCFLVYDNRLYFEILRNHAKRCIEYVDIDKEMFEEYIPGDIQEMSYLIGYIGQKISKNKILANLYLRLSDW